MAPPDSRDFAVFAKQSYPEALGLARLLAGGEHDAADLVQSAYLRVAERWRTIREPEAYLRRTVMNLAIDRSRHRRRWHWLSPAGDAEAPDLSAAPQRSGWEEGEPLIAGLRTLPDRQRQVLVLRYIYDFTEQQTARELGTTVGTVKALAHRGLARLRSQLPEAALSAIPTGPGGTNAP